jgi:hypothetical protein
MIRALLAAGTLACFSLSAQATPVTFDLAGAPTSSVDVVDFDGGFLCGLTHCGVTTTLNPLLDSLNQTLDVGESWSFDFFTLGFNGVGGGEGTISATLGFDLPTGAPVAVGTGEGGFGTFLGFISGGTLNWVTQPGVFSLGDGSQYSVTFANLSGLTVGSAVVGATITLLQGGAAVSVPEPGTLTLFGLGLLGVGFLARRRQRQMANPMAA